MSRAQLINWGSFQKLWHCKLWQIVIMSCSYGIFDHSKHVFFVKYFPIYTFGILNLHFFSTLLRLGGILIFKHSFFYLRKSWNSYNTKKSYVSQNLTDMIFVKTFTPADFPPLRNLPEKVRNLRHFRGKIINVYYLFAQNWNDIPIYIFRYNNLNITLYCVLNH